MTLLVWTVFCGLFVGLACGQQCSPAPCCNYASQANCPSDQFTGSYSGLSQCEQLISGPQADKNAWVFGILGDFGNIGPKCEAKVRNMIAAWESKYGPLTHIVTTGDNNYWDGECSSMGPNLAPYVGYFTPGGCIQPPTPAPPRFREVAPPPPWTQDLKKYPLFNGSTVLSSVAGARFWPTPGNHDFDKYTYNKNIPYLQYFPHLVEAAPDMNGDSSYGKGMFYSKQLQPSGMTGVTIFSLNSNVGGAPQDAAKMAIYNFQKKWLQQSLGASSAAYNLVFFHHAPYTSAQRDRPTVWMRTEIDPASQTGGFMYKQWGASVVIAGHQHVYERVVRSDGMLYLVNGLGGHERLYGVMDSNGCSPIQGSQYRYNAGHGFQVAVVTATNLHMCFYSAINGGLLDYVSVPTRAAPPPPPGTPGGAPAEASGKLSGGSIMCIVLLVVIVLYISIGIAYKYKVKGERGTDVIPNKEFWVSTPGLVKDGAIFSWGKTRDFYLWIRSKTCDRGTSF